MRWVGLGGGRRKSSCAQDGRPGVVVWVMGRVLSTLGLWRGTSREGKPVAAGVRVHPDAAEQLGLLL
ncbi:hypothetical protein GCM10010256_77090 [Streptomyces coeruleorubidus]|nr:hypothetical protein GCM10010256_77090 [Streptomyces coeruleorubidus]